MKTTPVALAAALALLSAPPLPAQPTTRLPGEWLVPSAANPKEFALIDAATGVVRAAFFSGDGVVDWSTPVATGISPVSDATAGTFGPTGETLALVSPESNRIALMEPGAASPFARFVAPAGIGPSGISTVGPWAQRRLIVGSRFNGTTPGRLESRRTTDGSGDLIADSPVNAAFRRIQPLTAPGSTTAVGLFTADSGSNTRSGLTTESSGSVSTAFKLTFSGNLEFATDVRSPHHPAKVLAVGYRKGSANGQIVEFSTPLSTSSSMSSVLAPLPFAAECFIPVVDGGAGPVTDGFFALASDGSQARWFRLNATTNGFDDGGAAHAFSPEDGTILSGLVVAPGLGVISLQAPSFGAPSTSYVARQWNGSEWAVTDSGKLPNLPGGDALPATLLFYSDDPVNDESARLLGLQNLGAWTRRHVSPDPVPAEVIEEAFPSSASGLTVSAATPITPPGGTNYVMTNQLEPAVSIAALGSAASLLGPDLTIEPPSGTYPQPFQVRARYDEERFSLFYLEETGDWQEWRDTLPVAWTTTLRFSLRSLADGTRGPITTRSYSLDPAELADDDSDGDGVPDYVEQHLGLDPFGGADSDGDGVSDLNEIAGGSDPADAASTPSSSFDLSTAGMSLVAIARHHAGTEAASGVDLEARDLEGALLAQGPVVTFVPALLDGGSRGAILRSASAPPFEELIALATPLYFDLQVGGRQGREMIAFVPADPQEPFDPGFTPSGTDLAANANGWIAAANAAAPGHPAASARSFIEPPDTAVAVLLEHLVHLALVDTRPPADPAPALVNFTFFPARGGDRSRSTLSSTDRTSLANAGFDFRSALDLALTAKTALEPLADAVYARHVAVADTTPAMAMPLDELRRLLRDGTPSEGYENVVTPLVLGAARLAYEGALSQRADAYRSYDTWEVEILASPSEEGVYRRSSDAADVILLNSLGDRFPLNQGLGLQAGTRFTVSGFTDTPPVGGFPTMEVRSAALSFEPVATDIDQDANLLDDEWERFFFGSTGQDPLSEPNGGGYTLLQYFLDGLDPRGAEVPAGAPVSLIPDRPLIAPEGGGAYVIEFDFPSAYFDRFHFVLERSTTLEAASFIEIPGAVMSPAAGDRVEVAVPAAAAPPGKAFFRIRMGLVD